ncbi:cytochrome c oxidase subunit 3 [Psychromarinibacter sp. C21-152]|uniref:Cytochrome c oxidase subunit 3 n=1 Tax=Psychromarinibacter sediminicola TaxID=3033385 RepID=A0AAE3TAW8_9RHOB|nr:cytochrome c oxidase subunit 3 [Psychromarinibacter sediminicola]MDF0602424.1 cytochrome c oxidase subunit 3 [Psychromarinibacter sediminicola]
MTEARGLDALPGELMMWVLIVSELMVFGAGLTAMLAMRLTDPASFAAAQEHLFQTGAALNTVVLITSGFLAAQALAWRRAARRMAARAALAGAAALGVLFLWIKGAEYAAKAADGIGWDSHPFFTFYYGLTGFHAAHVAAGIVLLLLVAWRDAPQNIEAGAMFWHMVDLVWVLLYPVVYLLG